MDRGTDEELVVSVGDMESAGIRIPPLQSLMER